MDSSGDKESEILEGVSDPLEELDAFSSAHPVHSDAGSDQIDI